MFCDILVRTNAFLDYKSKEFKIAKNWHFCKGASYSFCHKIENFPFVYFKQNRQEKTCFAIFKIEKSCSRLLNQGV